jgi:hypothetical protein
VVAAAAGRGGRARLPRAPANARGGERARPPNTRAYAGSRHRGSRGRPGRSRRHRTPSPRRATSPARAPAAGRLCARRRRAVRPGGGRDPSAGPAARHPWAGPRGRRCRRRPGDSGAAPQSCCRRRTPPDRAERPRPLGRRPCRGISRDMHPAQDLAEARPGEHAAGDPEGCCVTGTEGSVARRSHRRKRSATAVRPASLIHSRGVRASACPDAAPGCITPNSAPARPAVRPPSAGSVG